MNYRTLLIISLLILFVGIAGIMFLPSGDETPAQQAAEQVEPEKKVEERHQSKRFGGKKQCSVSRRVV